MADWQDLAHAAQLTLRDALGEPLTYTAIGCPEVKAVGLFRRRAERVELQDGVAVSATRPELWVVDADLPRAPAVADTCVVRRVCYRVVDVQPDGEGGSRLHLHEVP